MLVNGEKHKIVVNRRQRIVLQGCVIIMSPWVWFFWQFQADGCREFFRIFITAINLFERDAVLDASIFKDFLNLLKIELIIHFNKGDNRGILGESTSPNPSSLRRGMTFLKAQFMTVLSIDPVIICRQVGSLERFPTMFAISYFGIDRTTAIRTPVNFYSFDIRQI